MFVDDPFVGDFPVSVPWENAALPDNDTKTQIMIQPGGVSPGIGTINTYLVLAVAYEYSDTDLALRQENSDDGYLGFILAPRPGRRHTPAS